MNAAAPLLILFFVVWVGVSVYHEIWYDDGVLREPKPVYTV